MANELKMANVQSIQTLHERGWSNRRIARELGIHRDGTVVGRLDDSILSAGHGKAASEIRAGDVITHRLPLEKTLDAFKMMLAREEYFNKVMFFPEQ